MLKPPRKEYIYIENILHKYSIEIYSVVTSMLNII